MKRAIPLALALALFPAALAAQSADPPGTHASATERQAIYRLTLNIDSPIDAATLTASASDPVDALLWVAQNPQTGPIAQHQAVTFLGFFVDPRAETYLRDLTGDLSQPLTLRQRAIMAYAKVNPVALPNLVTPVLAEDDPSLRLTALAALATCDHPDARTLIAKIAASDPMPLVKARALDFLAPDAASEVQHHP